MRALSIAASGMAGQQTNVEVIAHNIANVNTTAFKAGKAEFTDLLYQAERPASAPSANGQEPVPEGAYVGLGVRTAAIRNLHIQGSLNKTGNPLDLALNGRGFFQVSGPNNETYYTRDGAFSTNATGQLVTQDGFQVIPAITIPPDTASIQINQVGQVFVDPGTGLLTQVGQLTLATFGNEGGLKPLGNNLFQETTASGEAQVVTPGSPSVGTIHQYYLENSNVDPVKEITSLINAQRSYEMNSKVIQAADSMFQTITQSMR